MPGFISWNEDTGIVTTSFASSDLVGTYEVKFDYYLELYPEVVLTVDLVTIEVKFKCTNENSFEYSASTIATTQQFIVLTGADPFSEALPAAVDAASVTTEQTEFCGPIAMELSVDLVTEDEDDDGNTVVTKTPVTLDWMSIDAGSLVYEPTTADQTGTYEVSVTYTLTDYSDYMDAETNFVTELTVYEPCTYQNSIVVTPHEDAPSNELFTYKIGEDDPILVYYPASLSDAVTDAENGATCGAVT